MPILHKVNDLFKKFYLLSRQLPKSDKLGICSEIAKIILNIHELIITAALTGKDNKSAKISLLQTVRIKTEILKKLIKLLLDLKIIDVKKYFSLQFDLQEISKDATNWQNYLITKEPKT